MKYTGIHNNMTYYIENGVVMVCEGNREPIESCATNDDFLEMIEIGSLIPQDDVSGVQIDEAFCILKANDMIATDIYRKRANGKTGNAFKVGVVHGRMLTVTQARRNGRQWRVTTPDNDFTGTRAECIVKAVQWLKARVGEVA
ncbi:MULTISPECIES: hypothetical protein [Gammaproteobacteria]|uniref:hypothetical protein n=1 Tax=Gammaproteobacteria TaxID=1236 RepID=UPI002FC97F13